MPPSHPLLERVKPVLAGPAIMAYNLLLLAFIDRTPFPPISDFAFAADLEDNWKAIRKEVDELLDNGPTIPAYFEVDPAQKRFWESFNRIVGRVRPVANPESADLDQWQTFVFRTYGRDVVPNLERCPETARVLQNVPGLSGAQFSVLNPGVSIPNHFGLFMGALRLHLGLRIPPGGKTAIRVAGQTREWEEGSVFVFEHSRWHTAWNNSSEPRVILILDFERPMRWRWLQALNHRVVVWLSESAQTKATVKVIEGLGNASPESGNRTATHGEHATSA